MRIFNCYVVFAAFAISYFSYAQDTQANQETKLSKTDYYKHRAQEDAKYEQEFVAENVSDEEVFWERQEAYEKELKKRDKRAYRAYMKGKKEAYAEHYQSCNHHCHHSDYYYHHASFYYYRYEPYYYNRYPQRNTLSTRVNVGVPRVSVGLF